MPPDPERPDGSLDALFSPGSVAVVGASSRANSVGRRVFANLLAGEHDLPVYAVNPSRATILRRRAYPDLASLPQPVDLAVIATPAETLPGLVEECVAAGVKAAVILSSGFRELGEAGAVLERRLMEAARGTPLRIVGPNSLGVINPLLGLNASFAPSSPAAGRVGFLSQSGALGSAILDWGARANVGFSVFLSTGSMLDVGWSDLIRHLGDDPHTASIVLYVESIDDPRSFLSAAREVALRKPIIALKAGSSEAGARAAALHTGSPVCDDEVLEAALRRTGVLRVRSIASLFYMAEILSMQPPPPGPRLTLLTNAGGPAVLATDALVEAGGELAALSDPTLDALEEVLSPGWSHTNPIDLLGDAGADRYAQALEIASREPASDGLLVILTPQAVSEPTRTAERMAIRWSKPAKPLLASWMGGGLVEEGAGILARSGIPCFPYPDTAARVFVEMWRYGKSLRSLYETPVMDAPEGAAEPDREAVRAQIARARGEGNSPLAPDLAREILARYGISLAPLAGPPPASRAPLRLASRVDAQFGPVLAIGAGAPFADRREQRALGLPPLNTTLARRVLEQARLPGVPGDDADDADTRALERLLVRFSRLLVEQRAIREIVLDPLYATAGGWVGGEPRVRLFAPGVDERDLPKLAIRPYPVEWVSHFATKTGRSVCLRPIRPEDEPLMIEFHRTLSSDTVRSRYLGALGLAQRVQHERLTRLCFIDYDREIALVADQRDPQTGEPRIRGVGRLVRLPSAREAEYAIVVSDALQGEGLGTRLLSRLVEIARAEAITRIVGEVSPDNRRMLQICRRLGFALHARGAEPVLVELSLGRA